VPVTGTVAGANALIISPLTASPTYPVAFGTSSTALITLKNPASNSIQVTSLNVTGANQGDFTAAPENCYAGMTPALPITAPAGGTCYVVVTFNPAAGASGLRNATLTLATSPAITGLPTVALQGEAVTNSQPTMSFSVVPDPMNFGGLQVGETSNAASVLLSITNNYPIPCAGGASSCGAPLIISSIAPGLSDYTVTGAGIACMPFPVTIPVGSNCTFNITFTPAQGGSRNTSLSIQSNDPQGTVQVPVYGTGLTLPLGEFLQTALNFGNCAIGVACPSLTTTLVNAGQSNLNLSAVTASTNFDVQANTCTGPIAPGGTCTVTVTFTPPASGFYNGTLTITDNDQFASQQTVNLAGSGATGPQIRLTPATINFGNQTLNTTSAAQIVTLTSTGDTSATFPANPVFTSQDFILESTTCSATLARGSSCAANVQFRPTEIELVGFPESGTLSATSNATGSPLQIHMQGTGQQSTTAATTTVLASSANPSTSGQSVTFTATVAGPSGNATVPTGSITFLDGATSLGSGTLNGSGITTYQTSALSTGSHSITAVYNGDSNFSGSTSNLIAQVVNAASKAASTTAVASSANPSTSGDSVTFTATVKGPTGNATVPTGSVNFLDGATTLGSGALNGSGAATYQTSSLSVASHSITAVYGGDSSFSGSTSPVLMQVVNAVAKASSTTIVISSANPSTAGQAVTFTATVQPPSGNATVPTGSANFLDGSTTLGSGTLNGSGAATYQTSSLAAGSHSITAVYAGDTNFNGSTSSLLAQVVNAVVLPATTTTVASSLNPSNPGQSVTFTAAVSGPTGNATVPTGTVTFKDGSTTLSSGSISAGAQATYATSSLSAGSHSITAVYGGDANFAGSTSAALTQTVNTPTLTIGINPSSLTVSAGATATTTITVTPQNGFNQQVTFACTGLPGSSSCTFSPSTVTPSGSAVTSTLTIATDVKSSQLETPSSPARQGRFGSEALLAAVLFGLGGIFWSRRRWNRFFSIAILLVGLALTLNGCGGKAGHKTPAGSSTISVTATATGSSQSASFTLTVQ
jgi:hypothetical protein